MRKPVKFVEELMPYIDWTQISSTVLLSEEFIEQHIDLVDWKWIQVKQNLSEGFIEKYSVG